jgi:hypothetical protein
MQEKKFCQSCLLPISIPTMNGTNQDGSPNKKFCWNCYRNGSFTAPEITLQEMEQKVKKMLEANQIPANVIDLSINYLPRLARWRN